MIICAATPSSTRAESIINLIWFQTAQTVTSSIITIIVSVIVLALLWNRRASEFFAA